MSFGSGDSRRKPNHGIIDHHCDRIILRQSPSLRRPHPPEFHGGSRHSYWLISVNAALFDSEAREVFQPVGISRRCHLNAHHPNRQSDTVPQNGGISQHPENAHSLLQFHHAFCESASQALILIRVICLSGNAFGSFWPNGIASEYLCVRHAICWVCGQEYPSFVAELGLTTAGLFDAFVMTPTQDFGGIASKPRHQIRKIGSQNFD